jgi:hypothetical protein
MKTKAIFFGIFFCTSLHLTAQIERSAFTSTGRGVATTFVTDYHSIGINPANLARSSKYEKKYALGFIEGGVTLYSEALSRKELRENIAGFDESITPAEKRAFAANFANKDFAGNVDMQLLGFAIDFNDKNIGGFAISVRDRIQYYSKFNVQASEILFTGWNALYFNQLQLDGDNGPIIENTGNLSTDTLNRVVRGISTNPDFINDLFNGSQMKNVWYREFNLAYGREIYGNDTWSLAGGIGLKYLQGISIIDIDVAKNDLRAISSTSPSFGIDYGTAAINNPSAQAPNESVLPSSVGGGFGFDVGFNFLYKEKLKIGVALNDIGSVTYKGNVYQSKDTLVFDVRNDGVNSLNFISEADVFTGKDGLFKQEGVAKEVIQLPTNFRLGASYLISEKLELGADFYLSLNDAPGSFVSPVYGVGGDYQATKWLRLSFGVMGGGNYDLRIPVGLTFVAGNGSWEAGLASSNLVTYLTSNNATISASMGFLRFRFGKMVKAIEETLY